VLKLWQGGCNVAKVTVIIELVQLCPKNSPHRNRRN
jgi:hypothetical protein